MRVFFGRVGSGCCGLAVAMLILASGMTGPAGAQSGPPNALQGFSQNRNQPIRIESVSLEVRDKDKVATFIDDVRVTQGDTILESRRLVVYYDGDAGSVGRPGGGAGGNQQIRRLEAKGGVVVTQKDQTAVGDEGVYDMATNRMTLTGNVVVKQGQNVIRGHRLWVDLETGMSRVEAGTGGSGRVQGVFLPGSAGSAQQGGGAPAATPPRSGPQAAPPGRTGGASDRGPGRRAPAQPPRRSY